VHDQNRHKRQKEKQPIVDEELTENMLACAEKPQTGPKFCQIKRNRIGGSAVAAALVLPVAHECDQELVSNDQEMN